MSLTHDIAHAAEGRALLCEQYKGNAQLLALLDANSAQVQALEDALWQLQTLRLPPSAASGAQLDKLGELVGQLRKAMADAQYLPWLQARILANLSKGAAETLIRIVDLITGGTHTIETVMRYPAALELWIGGALPIDPADLANILGVAKAGGVNVQAIYSLSADADTFTFASGDTPEASTTQGWADDAQTTGGLWADAVKA